MKTASYVCHYRHRGDAKLTNELDNNDSQFFCSLLKMQDYEVQCLISSPNKSFQHGYMTHNVSVTSGLLWLR